MPMTGPHMPLDGKVGAIVYAELLGLTCSICAPDAMTQEEIEAVAMEMVPAALGPWHAVDKSKPPISIGGPTPNPCDRYPGRRHWFLISGDLPEPLAGGSIVGGGA